MALDDRVGGRARLDLDHDPGRVGQPLEHLRQRRHGQAAALERMALAVRAGECCASIGLANLVHREIGDAAGAVGGAVERLVVDDGQLTVRGEVDVELDRIGPGLDAQLEGFHRVFGSHPPMPRGGRR